MNEYIDLRKEMKECIDNHGHWAVLRRAIPGAKCPCVNPQTDDSDARCQLCLSTGRAYVDQFIKLRKSRDVRLTQVLGAEVRTAVGQATPVDNVFYVEHSIIPANQDFILEVKLDYITGEPIQPFTVIAVHDISDVREQRDRRGRVEYFAITAELQNWPEFNIG